MSGFEMRAQFYPLVTDLERLKEEAAEGVPYPFVTEELLELSPKDYRQFCSALGQRYAFETDIPKEGYDTVYGAFHCSLVTAVSEKEAILLTRQNRKVHPGECRGPACCLQPAADCPADHDR